MSMFLFLLAYINSSNIEIEQRFNEVMHEVCTELEIEIVAIECDKDHTRMFLDANMEPY